jgi:integrase
MTLTDVGVRNAKPKGKLYRLYDERGMYLEVSATGGKWWRLKYRFGGKENRMSLGVYPDVGLKEARDRRDEARKLLANGIDPGFERKVQKAARVERAANSFEAVAREWFAKLASGWAKSHADKIMARLENDVFPWLGGRAIAEIKAPEVLMVLRRVEARGALDTSHRVHQNCGQIFRYAVATGRAERDVSADLRGALPPARHTHFASFTEPAEVAALLRALDGFQGTFVVQCALRLAPLLFVRPGELRRAEWAQFDFGKAQWRFTASKTKTELIVPLATQAVAILHDLHALTGQRKHVFPGRDVKKPMSGAAINAALRRMGFNTKTEITGHGFRAMARTILDERLRFPSEVIEHQLAHRVPGPLGDAYNRTKFIDERIRMMQAWADYLDELKADAEVIKAGAASGLGGLGGLLGNDTGTAQAED